MKQRRDWLSVLRLGAFFRFLLGSACGLAVDLGGFLVLSGIRVEPGLANLISSFSSITVVYLIATRLAFGAGTSARTYAAFVIWYSCSILAFSLLIEFVSTTTGTAPILCKACSIPISFALNYAFSRWLFRDSAKRVDRPVIDSRTSANSPV